MKHKSAFWLCLLAVLLCAAIVCMAFADGIQRSGGAVEITDGQLTTQEGILTYMSMSHRSS